MSTIRALPLAAAIALAWPAPGLASSPIDPAELQALRAELRQLRDHYEQRIASLEARLAQTEKSATAAGNSADQARLAASRAEDMSRSSGQRPGSAADFNPAMSVILSGRYTHRTGEQGPYGLTGFMPSQGEVAPPPRSFSLGESELVLSANIDTHLRGQLIVALPPEEGEAPAVEEAYIQTLGLGQGLNLKAGRLLSGIGYINEQHPHAWDFSDASLPYKAFFGNQSRTEGIQLKWLAPTDLFLELGAELGRGGAFPSTERDRNGAQSTALFAHLGGDLGVEHNWRAGLSWLRAEPRERGYEDTDSTGLATVNSFSGSSRTWIADFVWKWAPQGNASERYLKFQGEYLRRTENGRLAFDNTAAGGALLGEDHYTARQSGWYAQALYQFQLRWRLGYRHDRLDHGTMSIGLVDSGFLSGADLPLLTRHDPRRNTLMLDWSPSEFSRIRLQWARDEATLGRAENQLLLHYIVSMGSHGAHKY